MRYRIKSVFISLMFLSTAAFITDVSGEANWPGVDKTVVEKFAAEHGRTAWTPFINTDQGDLLLFVFLLAGIAGGFMIGYNFQKLFVESRPPSSGGVGGARRT